LSKRTPAAVLYAWLKTGNERRINAEVMGTARVLFIAMGV
jgi:hypothetical protein